MLIGFVSNEFKSFEPKNGIRHINSTLYHAASNGFVERVAWTFKQDKKKQGYGTVETTSLHFVLTNNNYSETESRRRF